MKKVAITWSGGIDSTTLVYMTVKNKEYSDIYLLACNYGQASWNKTKELLDLHNLKLLTSTTINVHPVIINVSLPLWSVNGGLHKKGFIPPEISPEGPFDYSEQKKTYDYAFIDGRNAFLFLYMFSYCSQQNIPLLLSGHQYESEEWQNLDSYRHRTEDFGTYFIDRMNLVQEVGFQNRVRLEAPFLSMRYSKKDIIAMSIDLGIDIKDTYSCQFYPKCFKCDNCVNRKHILKEMNIKDE